MAHLRFAFEIHSILFELENHCIIFPIFFIPRMINQEMPVGIGGTQTTSFSNRRGWGLGTIGTVVEVPHVLSYPVVRKTVAREAPSCGNVAVRHTFANSFYYICDLVGVAAGNFTILKSCSKACKMRKK